jgi:hypothetical protein
MITFFYGMKGLDVEEFWEGSSIQRALEKNALA